MGMSAIMAASFDEDNDPEFNKYCKFVDSGVPFFKKYPIKNAINPAPKDTKVKPQLYSHKNQQILRTYPSKKTLRRRCRQEST